MIREAVLVVSGVAALALACGRDSCIAPDGGCAAGCVVNAGNQCVPAGSTSTTTGGNSGDSGTSGGGSSSTANATQVPNGAHVSLDCRPYNIPAYAVSDCLYSHYCGDAGTVPCTMKIADKDGMVMKTRTTAGFHAEAGDISPSATSPAYDPSKLLKDQEDLGHAVGFLEACNAPLPLDVDPFQGEQSVHMDFGCGMRTSNPRDGLVTVISWVRGEEGYVDLNHNGKYDAGEPFIDLGEPYVDANDNGQWDLSEWYLDVNDNGKHDGPNGKWDADITLWTQARVVYTGFPISARDASGNELFSRFYTPSSTPPTPSAPAPAFSVAVNASVNYGIFLTDEHLNPLSSLFTYDAASATGNTKVTLFGPDASADTDANLGMSFRLLYCDKSTAPANCKDGSPDQACTTNPCYVVPDVGLCANGVCSGFIYGNRGSVLITGQKAGSDIVSVTATLEEAKTTFTLAGQCTP